MGDPSEVQNCLAQELPLLPSCSCPCQGWLPQLSEIPGYSSGMHWDADCGTVSQARETKSFWRQSLEAALHQVTMQKLKEPCGVMDGAL